MRSYADCSRRAGSSSAVPASTRSLSAAAGPSRVRAPPVRSSPRPRAVLADVDAPRCSSSSSDPGICPRARLTICAASRGVPRCARRIELNAADPLDGTRRPPCGHRACRREHRRAHGNQRRDRTRAHPRTTVPADRSQIDHDGPTPDAPRARDSVGVHASSTAVSCSTPTRRLASPIGCRHGSRSWRRDSSHRSTPAM